MSSSLPAEDEEQLLPPSHSGLDDQPVHGHHRSGTDLAGGPGCIELIATLCSMSVHSTMTFKSIITLANSIIGVSILAMPFCFKQCGIILATLSLILCGMLVKLTCHLLLKSAIIARRRNYELLAYQTFGPGGKLAVEVCMIGFLMGTSIAFFVVIGDLAPPIIANLTGVESSSKLRFVILVGLGLFVALPLALLRNVESLAGLCTASIGFYLTVLVFIVMSSWPSLLEGSWASNINFWRPVGIFQCLPIFTMALSCQPQVFEIYDALPEPSPTVMNAVVRGAVNLCSGCYICVGIFGYITFSSVDISGNILTEFPPTLLVEIIKLGFVLSVAVSFPLVVFPCRTAIHSLMFRKGSGPSDMTSNYIPPDRFNAITVVVILITLCLGIMIPDIELVLGLVGATIGSAICVIFPSIIFTQVMAKNTTEKLLARFIIFVGFAIMICGTYVNLSAANRVTTSGPLDLNPDQEMLINKNGLRIPQPVGPLQDNQNFPLLEKIVAKSNNLSQAKGIIEKVKLNPEADGVKLDVVSEENREEAKPAKPVDLDSPDIRQEPVEPKPPNDEMEKVPVDSGLEIPVEKHEEPAREDGGNEIVVKKEIIEEVIKEEVQAKVKEAQKEIEAAKEEHEVKVKEKEEELQNREEKADKLLQELEKQKLEQKEIIKEQKEVLKAMKEHVDGDQDHQLKIEEQIDPKHGDDKIPSYEIVQDVIKESADDLSKLKVMDPSRDISNLRQKQPHVPNVEVVRKDKPRVIIGDTIQQEIPYQPRSSLHKVESNSVFNKNPELLANNSKPYSLRGSGSHELVNKSLPRREDDPDKNPSRDLKSVKEISLLKEESGVGEQRVKRDGGDADSIFEETVIGGIVDETLCENCGQFNVQSVEKRLK